MKVCFLIGICLILTTSCNTLKWRKKYALKKMETFQERYIKDNQFTMSLSDFGDFTGGPLKKLKRNQYKKNISLVEKGLVFNPDSTSNIDGKVDTFYINPYKILYIQKKKLKTKNIHFIN